MPTIRSPPRRSPRLRELNLITGNLEMTTTAAIVSEASVAVTSVGIESATGASIPTSAVMQQTQDLSAMPPPDERNTATIAAEFVEPTQHVESQVNLLLDKIKSLEAQLFAAQTQRLESASIQSQALQKSAQSASSSTQNLAFSLTAQPPSFTTQNHIFSIAAMPTSYTSYSQPFHKPAQPTFSSAYNLVQHLTEATASCNSYSPSRPSSATTHTINNNSTALPSISVPLVSTATNDARQYLYPSPINAYDGTRTVNYGLPRKVLDLPEFGGQPEDWPLFINVFNQTTLTYGYTNLENNQRLMKCLKGEAREVVQSLLIHPDNVPAVIDQLTFRFGRPELLIRSQLLKIKEIAPIPEHALERLVPYATVSKNLAVFLQSLNAQPHLANPMLLEELVSKLPNSKKIDWAKYATTLHPYPTVVDFSNWLNNVANLICSVQLTENRRRVILHAVDSESATNRKNVCPICKNDHHVAICKQFIKLTISQRWEQVKDKRLCFSCLSEGHSVRNCRKRYKCSVEGCQKRHNKLLHENRTEKSKQQNSEPTRPTVLNCALSAAKRGQTLFRVLPITVYGNEKTVNTYAMLDEGSSVTMMDRSLKVDLGLRGKPKDLTLQWVGGRTTTERTEMVDMRISGVNMTKQHTLKNVYVVSKLDLPVQSLSISDLSQINFQEKDLPSVYSNINPKILIGLDHCHLGLPLESVKSNGHSGLVAANTELGWVVFGPKEYDRLSQPICLHAREVSDENLHKTIKEYFDCENFGVKSAPEIKSETDLRAEKLLKENVKRHEGRYEAGLLWKSDKISLPDSYQMAERRMLSLENKMKKNINFSAAYSSIIESYVKKGYAKKLSERELQIKSERIWYLPHFAVTKSNKPEKLRLVFDAAATVNGTSLNDCLLKGPQEYDPLPNVLFNFRNGAVAVTGDIKEMFHQILIQQKDRVAQRFLWRLDTKKPPEVYEMQVMIFGAACSPCIAQYVKILNAMEYQRKWPRAFQAIKKYHYVDDFVDSFATPETAIVIAKQVRHIHQAAGFQMRAFMSNSAQVTMALENDNLDVNQNEYFENKNSTNQKILGMYWKPNDDTFRYEFRFNEMEPMIMNGSKIPTKRQLLSIVMSIFDPLGFLGPILVTGKLLMKEVWKRDIAWDTALPSTIAEVWQKWRLNVLKVEEVRIPRHYFRGSEPIKVQLHVFVDASQEAFAAAAYWRYETADGSVNTSFVCSKNRCAPTKPVTIPRLELQAAVLGTRLMQTIKNEHSYEIETCYLWSDSTTVLQWINAENRRYKPFVAHRIAEILASTAPSEWKWVPTKYNIADKATRLDTNAALNDSPEWWNGPKFLQNSPNDWPKAPSIAIQDNEEEVPPKLLFFVNNSRLIELNRFSSFLKAKRTLAWVLRFVRTARKQHNPTEGKELSVPEIKEAEAFLCRQIQFEAYSSELKLLKDGLELTRCSSLRVLRPFVDKQGVLRVGGRISAATWIPYETKHPVILPATHYFTILVVRHYHNVMHHQNVETTIGEIRQKFWVPRLRQVLRSVINKCLVCRMRKVIPTPPLMGQLPTDRLTPYIRPFSYTGVDYFGPVNVTIGRRVEKRWISLFTCLTTRAIHLEVAHDLSTDAFILVLRNFINRRGTPVRIRSDNGRNFVGADKEAKRFCEVFDINCVQRESTSRDVEWRFNCPNNPSEGGIWERMVQSVKRVLRSTLKEIAPREYVLNSLIIEAENIINSRPLTHLPIEPDQEEPLTPNHFLLGGANTAQTPMMNTLDEKICALRKQWRIARQLRNHFWKRWIIEYLPTLTRRAKWCEVTKPISVNDVVFICDPNMPRKQWCRGLVQKLHSGADGVIRRAEVKTSTGVVCRPVSRLAVLDITEEQSIHGGGDVTE